MPLNIAIDGPVGAGKSTIANAVADALGILHLDTGAMYRAIGLTAIRKGIDLQDEETVTALCGEIDLKVQYGGNGQITMVDGEDVTGMLRTEDVSMAASTVSRYAGVRKAMVAIQQKLASETDMLVDGRDIGTVVLPKATAKIFLTATAEERAMRRFRELQQKGTRDTYEQVLEDLKRRDDQDMNRKVDPLRCAEDAVRLDTTHMGFDEVVEAILNIVKEARA